MWVQASCVIGQGHWKPNTNMTPLGTKMIIWCTSLSMMLTIKQLQNVIMEKY